MTQNTVKCVPFDRSKFHDLGQSYTTPVQITSLYLKKRFHKLIKIICIQINYTVHNLLSKKRFLLTMLFAGGLYAVIFKWFKLYRALLLQFELQIKIQMRNLRSRSSKSVSIYQNMRCHIAEDSNLLNAIMFHLLNVTYINI
jgi:hypothetical protein